MNGKVLQKGGSFFHALPSSSTIKRKEWFSGLCHLWTALVMRDILGDVTVGVSMVTRLLWLQSSLVCKWRYYLNFSAYDKANKTAWVNAWEPSRHDTCTRDRCWFLHRFTFEDGTYRLSQNVVKRLPIYAAQNLARGKPLLQVVVIRRYMTETLTVIK